MWMIEKTDGTHVGDLCFKGLKENGNPEIGYGILDEFQGPRFIVYKEKQAMNDFTIRLEEKKDYREVENLVRESFCVITGRRLKKYHYSGNL